MLIIKQTVLIIAKSQRKRRPFSQLPDVYAALAYLDIKFAETEICETDDWVAGYALTYGQEAEIIISSFDSDFFQLITDKVSVLRYRGDSTIICTPDYKKISLLLSRSNTRILSHWWVMRQIISKVQIKLDQNSSLFIE